MVYIMSTLQEIRAGLFSTIIVFLLVSQVQPTVWTDSTDNAGVSLRISFLSSRNNSIVEYQPWHPDFATV